MLLLTPSTKRPASVSIKSLRAILTRGGCQRGRGLGLVGAVTATGEARAVGGMGAVGLGVKGGFGFGGVAASGHAIVAVAKPRVTAIPAQGAGELASVAGAGLVGASHASVIVTTPCPA